MLPEDLHVGRSDFRRLLGLCRIERPKLDQWHLPTGRSQNLAAENLVPIITYLGEYKNIPDVLQHLHDREIRIPTSIEDLMAYTAVLKHVSLYQPLL